jgi:HSP20 family protein
VLGDNLDLDHIQAGYRDGVLKLVIPVAERAKPRKISISHNGGGDQAITTGNGHNHEGAADSSARNTVDADAVNA